MLRRFSNLKFVGYKKKLKKKKNFVPTYLPKFFWPCYQKQTIFLGGPYMNKDLFRFAPLAAALACRSCGPQTCTVRMWRAYQPAAALTDEKLT